MLTTKAIRIVLSSCGRGIVDFSARRTQGMESGIITAVTSYEAGFLGTSNILASSLFHIPVYGTMAHSFVMSFESEEEAFRRYFEVYPKKTVLLVDTYNTIDGIRNAIKVAKDFKKKGDNLLGIRIDSGNLVKLSKIARRLLDENGLRDTKIMLSGGLDEYQIDELILGGAEVDLFGVGTKLGVSSDAPFLDSAYKLVEYNGRGRRKFSPDKITIPYTKQVFRIFRGDKIYRDIVKRRDEKVKSNETPLLKPTIKNGERVCPEEDIKTVREKISRVISKLPDGIKSIRKSHNYRIEFSKKLLGKQDN